MKVLIVARKKENGFAPFVTEQVDALKKTGVECRYFPMEQRGLIGYLRRLPAFKKSIHSFNPDIIHAHYGLCGVFANLQRHVPVITTYHGSDINNKSVLPLSKLSVRLSVFNIFVSKKNIDIVHPDKNFALVPCGINLEDYPVIDKSEARQQLRLKADGKYVLFSSAFDIPVKNAPLAKEAVKLLPNAELLEFKGYTRQQVGILLQAVDVLLITSHTEGSPQVVKEALACGCPVVSVDVGDVRERIDGIEGCWVVTPTKDDIANALKKALAFSGRTNGRKALVASELTNDLVAGKLLGIYNSLK